MSFSPSEDNAKLEKDQAEFLARIDEASKYANLSIELIATDWKAALVQEQATTILELTKMIENTNIYRSTIALGHAKMKADPSENKSNNYLQQALNDKRKAAKERWEAKEDADRQKAMRAYQRRLAARPAQPVLRRTVPEAQVAFIAEAQAARVPKLFIPEGVEVISNKKVAVKSQESKECRGGSTTA